MTEKGLETQLALIKTIMVIVLVVMGVVIYELWQRRLADDAQKAPPDATVNEPVRKVALPPPPPPPPPPVHVGNERVQLPEGQYRWYSMTLSTLSRVQVQVTAFPQVVDVVLLSAEQLQRFQNTPRAPVNMKGEYIERTATLSENGVSNFDKTEWLPPGQWTVVVLRPRESVIFTQPTVAEIAVTYYPMR